MFFFGYLISTIPSLGIFRTWKLQKRKVDAENEKVFRARAILTKNFKARVLQAWRVVNQEQQIISPMVARRERKEMARYSIEFGKAKSRSERGVWGGKRVLSLPPPNALWEAVWIVETLLMLILTIDLPNCGNYFQRMNNTAGL